MRKRMVWTLLLVLCVLTAASAAAEDGLLRTAWGIPVGTSVQDCADAVQAWAGLALVDGLEPGTRMVTVTEDTLAAAMGVPATYTFRFVDEALVGVEVTFREVADAYASGLTAVVASDEEGLALCRDAMRQFAALANALAEMGDGPITGGVMQVTEVGATEAETLALPVEDGLLDEAAVSARMGQQDGYGAYVALEVYYNTNVVAYFESTVDTYDDAIHAINIPTVEYLDYVVIAE